MFSLRQLCLVVFCLVQFKAQIIPPAPANCPAFDSTGDVSMKVDGLERRVRVILDATKQTMAGPLLFYWFATGSQVQEGPYALGFAAMQRIMDMGGVIVVPYATLTGAVGNGNKFNYKAQWACQNFCTQANKSQEDLHLMDMVVACLVKANMVNPKRIHSLGLSAGAMFTAQLGYLRSNYIASTVQFSGGFFIDDEGNDDSAPLQNKQNKFPSLVYYGGKKDYIVTSFSDSSLNYKNYALENGQKVILCNHRKGHRIPTENQAYTLDFLLSHPFGASEQSGRQSCGLPAGAPSYCKEYGCPQVGQDNNNDNNNNGNDGSNDGNNIIGSPSGNTLATPAVLLDTASNSCSGLTDRYNSAQCAAWQHFCTNERFKPWMLQNCAKFCCDLKPALGKCEQLTNLSPLCSSATKQACISFQPAKIFCAKKCCSLL